MYGELVPLGGGDTIELQKTKLLIGRRESCDICLRFANVSAHHCELYFEDGYLYARDLNSRNGIKVNGSKVQEKRLDPGDTFAVAKHKYRVEYSPAELGAVGPPPDDDQKQEIMRESLLTRAGLEKPVRRSSKSKRYDPSNNEAGQIDLPSKPV
ncbi:MAG: FHA domain-containing protein [Planctomycetota bacterium]